jgi:tripartite motif-containing protein 71
LCRTYGSQGSEAGQFREVGCVAVHGDGAEQRVAAVDVGNHRVLVFNVESGECVASVGSEGKGPGQFDTACGAAFNRMGELFVSDLELDRIQVFDRAGAYLRGFGVTGQREGQFNRPGGLAFTPGGKLVVCDEFNYRVQVLLDDGTFVRAFGSEGTGEGMFNCPCGVAVGGDGRIAVVDKVNARVQVFDEGGGFVRSIRCRGTGGGSVAVGVEGDIFVSNLRNEVQVFSNNGVHLQTIGKGGHSDVDLHGPIGVAVDSEGRVFVGCNWQRNVQMLF